ncbi:MAG: DUF2520 domain-containing protein [Rickettsiella sp.]|nr:DUF2520 domain-containing protein [Rickettsiella sp.]
MKLTIIGCGRLGKTLAYLWQKNKLVSIQDIYNTNTISASIAAKFLGNGTACQSMSQFKAADMYLIATPDDQIEMACQALAEEAPPRAGSLVFHCSGLHTSACLDSVKSLGCYTASVHPLFGFSDPAIDIYHFAGSYCSFEGSSEVLEQISLLIEKIGGQLFMIEKQYKALYHAASVFASNYLVTLSAIAADCFKKSGLSGSLSKSLVHTLMEQSLRRIKSFDDIRNALTGPIQRSDKATLKKHLKLLETFDDLESVYKSLGKTTIKLTTHHAELKKELEALF